MDDNGTDYEWEGEDYAVYPEQTDFTFDFEQQSQMGLGTDEDEFFIDGLMGGGIGPWKVSLSAQGLRDLKQSRSEGNHLHILGKLQSLASGDWVRRSVARPFPPCGRHFRVRLFQALYGGNGRILWQVDVGYDEKCGSNSQIVRVWSIGDVKEIQASLDAVERSQKTFSATRVERCKINLIDKAARLKLPVVFESSPEEENRENGGPETETDSRDPPELQECVLQDMLISGRFHTLTVNVFTSIIHGQDHSDFPFDVTGPEATIIKHKNASFILGRSGTGKTSCLLYKLMCRYLARNIVMQEEPIRQLLLTRSEPLARKLQTDVKLLIDTQLLRMADYPNGYGDVITYEDENGAPGQIDSMDMDADTTEDLFSLRRENFPFVCTFDHFLRRLENTITANDRRNISSRRPIDYTIFREAYWPRFPPRSKGHLQADMVFTEIMGVLKGGGDPLSRQEYIDTSARIAPTFTTEEDRQAVYTLFEFYEKRKRAQDEQDGIDRVRSVMRVLEHNEVVRGNLLGMFEEVYIDEVQDQRPLEISLLLTLVQNPRGIHFAGDSAQCISQDSTFRFANLKALFFNHFSGHPSTAIDPSTAKATRFTLSHNFRSHQGILRLASWVMDKLWRGFPDCVDKLPPEIGTHMGPKPVLIIGPSLISFLQGAAGSTTGDEINTQQIIIVRDRAVQRELEPQLPDGSIVFTVLQSKGMEYDDVFLYEFFSRSPSLGGFRNMMERGGWEGYASMHPSMCNELKNLYVAITRPRSRLFILESDPGCIPELLTEHVPVQLVVVKRFNNEDLQGLSREVRGGGTPSSEPQVAQTGTTGSGRGAIFDTVRPTNMTTVQQWIETGDQCMERGIFDQALRCFKNARDPAKIKLASASLSEQMGRECSARRDLSGAQVHFKQASDDFIELGMKERAAACLEARGDLVKAAELYKGARRYEKAARLFRRAGQHERAANEYLRCGKSFMGLLALYEGKLYERLISDFHSHCDEIPDNDRLTYARECNRYVRQKVNLKPNLKSRALAMFTSDDEKEAFLKELKYNKELVEFYVCRGRIKEALLHAVTSGDFDDALEGMIERGRDNSEVVMVVKGVEKEDMRLEDVFNYAQTKRMLANMSRQSKSLSLGYNGRHEGIEWGHKWEEFVAVAGEFIESGMELERGCIEEGWIREYLDTIVSVHIKYFLRLAKHLTAIPHAYLYGLAQKINEISTSTKDSEVSKSTKDNGIPQAILLALGVLHIPGEAKPYKVLGWSCLNSPQVGNSDFEYKVMVKMIVNYLRKRLQDASPLVEKKAKELWEGSSGMETRCAACMARVAWGGPQVEGLSTKCSHNLVTKTQFEKSIQDLIGIQSSFATLGEKYKLLRGVEAPQYLLQLNDYWLDAILKRLTYHSACFQSAEHIVNLRSWLRTPEASTIAWALRMRFWKRWESWKVGRKGDFTQLLESYQLGVNLGLRQSVEHLINIHRTKIETYHGGAQGAGGSPESQSQQKEEHPSEGDVIFEAFRQYRALHEWRGASQCSMEMLLNRIDGLLMTLHGMLQATKYLSFHHASVISVFESILTLLLFASQRTNIVIPASWTHLHLPLWAPILRDCTDNEMDCYRQALVRTMDLFYNWVANGHESAPQVGSLQRRCSDLCFVVLVNSGTAAGCQVLWAKATEVFTNQILDRWEGLRTQPRQLIEQLYEAFKLYNGTDTLMLHVSNGPLDKRAHYLSSFATLQQLPPRLERRPPPRDILYSKYLIASWCRRHRDIRAEYKKYMESATWQAIDRLYALCKNNLPLAAVGMTEGLDLYLLLQELWRRIGAADEKEREQAEKKSAAERKRAEKKKKGLLRNTPHNKEVDVVSVESKQKCAEGSMVADQIAETAKTDSEKLHVQFQERIAFFNVGTTVDVEAESWRKRCREEMVAAREMETMLNDWTDKLDGKGKKGGTKNLGKKATSVPPARERKGAANGQLATPELQQDQVQKDICGEEKGKAAAVGTAMSRKAKRKAWKEKKKEEKQKVKKERREKKEEEEKEEEKEEKEDEKEKKEKEKKEEEEKEEKEEKEGEGGWGEEEDRKK